MARQTTAAWMRFVGFLIVAAGAGGCSTLQTESAGGLADQTRTDSAARGEVIVAMRDGDNQREYLKAPLTDTMLVQDALKGSGALKRFRRMNVVVVRKVPGSFPLRMPVHFNSAERRVSDGTNYALHPGDIIEVTEDTSTMLDRMIDSAMGSLGPITGGARR